MACVDDVQEFILEKPSSVLKSPEELERFTVDEQLRPIERAVYLLSSGQEVQRISVVNSLPELLRDNFNECVRRIVPKIREVVRVADADMQIAAGDVFYEILQKNLVPLNTYSQTFLQTIFMCVDNKDPNISESWILTLLNVIELLPKDVIAKEILSKTIAKGQIQQPVESRIASCRILGKAVTRCDPFIVKRDVLPTVRMLCQDVSYEVRATMTRLLDPVARSLGVDETKTSLLPDLVELSKDEHSLVRLTAFETIIAITSLLDAEALTLVVIPLVSDFCDSALSNRDETLCTVSQHFGQLCHGMVDYLDEERRKYFVEFYKKKLCRVGLAKKTKGENAFNTYNHNSNKSLQNDDDDDEFGQHDWDLDECRRFAAYNMPAMTMFVGPRSFKSELNACMNSLCNDSCERVRRTVSAGFHEVVKILGATSGCLLPDLIQLLNDNCTEVLASGFIANLPDTLEVICHGGRMASSDAKLYELLCAVIKCEAVIFSGNDWRLQEEYMKMLCCLPTCFASDLVHRMVSPLVLRKLTSARALPVRRAAVLAQLKLVRHNSHIDQRESMCNKLVDEFAKGRSFYRRSLYIDVCLTALDVFSRAFFKQYFCEALMDLHTDRVPNIRLRVCAMMPRVKRTMRQPGDKMLTLKLEGCVRYLMLHERDRDVLAVLKKAVEELDMIPIELETQLARKTEEDRIDQKKFDEERLLFEEENRRSASADGGNPPRKKLSTSSSDKRDVSKQPVLAKKSPARVSSTGATTSSSSTTNNNKRPQEAVASSGSTGGGAAARQPSSGLPTVNQSNSAAMASIANIKKKVSTSLSSGALPNISSLSTAPNNNATPGTQTEVRKSTVQRRTSLNETKHK